MNETAIIIQKRVCKCCGETLPLTMFGKGGLGYYYTCKDCMKKRQKEGHKKKNDISDLEKKVQDARNLRIQDFNPRELMSELKRRGYEFTMKYVETHIIKSDDL